MAIGATYTKKQEQLAQNQAPVGSNKPYSGMQGVSQNTANNLGNYQQGYQQGQQAQAAQQNLQNIQAQKPQTYQSKYGQQLDNLLKQIQNPKEFKYEFNGDNLFKYYADLYTQKGKQASMDAMGQAAALTGGYGNSYAQQAGQQGYQQYLLNLYDKGMDLYDRAYQRNQDQLGNAKDAYNLTANAENMNYGQYRDALGDWQNERAFAADRADTERDFDYNQYQQDLNYWTGMAQNEAAMAAQQQQADRDEAYRRDTFNWQQGTDARDFGEQQRQANLDNQYRYDAMAQDQNQFNATTKLNYDKLAQDQAQFEAGLSAQEKQDYRKYAVDYVSAILANGQIPSNELLAAAGLSYEDAQKLVAQIVQGGYGPGPGSNENGDGNGRDISFLDANDYIYRTALATMPNLKMSDINPSMPSNATLGDLNNIVANNPTALQKHATTQTITTASSSPFNQSVYAQHIQEMAKKKNK